MYSTSKPMLNLGTVGFEFAWPFPSGTCVFSTSRSLRTAQCPKCWCCQGSRADRDISAEISREKLCSLVNWYLEDTIQAPFAPWRELLSDWWDAHLKICWECSWEYGWNCFLWMFAFFSQLMASFFFWMLCFLAGCVFRLEESTPLLENLNGRSLRF